jgi:hypothetical protein
MKKPEWKKNAERRATNPEYPAILLKSIKNELDRRNQPDRAYIKSKIKALEDFVDNNANFVSDEELFGKEIANKIKIAEKRRKLRKVI